VAARLRSELAAHDILHLHEYRSHLGAAAATQAADTGIPYVLHPQGTLRPGERSRLLKHVYDRSVGRRLVEAAERIIAGTEREREQIVAAGIPEARVVVVPNGMDVARFERLPDRGRFRDRHGISRDAPLVLCVGRLEANKGQDVLVRAFCELDVPQARLVLIGPNSGMGPRLRRMAAAGGREAAVLVTGPLPDYREVVEALVDADVYVQPSRNEAFGMAILEACAASLPLVLSEGCQNAAAFRDRAALVVPCESGAMAEAVRRLLADPALRARFGAAGRGILGRDFTLPAVAARLEQVYEEAVARK
jgi:glycosyltransferase involved in cell wall biosynthesis